MHKRICLSGADMYELEEVFTGRRGIASVRTGYINAAPNARHEDVATGAAGGRMGIEICYDPKKIDISQLLDWMNSMIDEHLHNLFFEDAIVRGRMPEVKGAILSGEISPTQAVAELLSVFDVHRAAGRQVDLFTN